MKKLLCLASILLLAGCSANDRARNYGGTMKIELPSNTKFINATWRGDNVWYLYRDRKPGESVDIYTFKEDSSFGLLEGAVIFNEK
jgi:uncharacterized lipoprotein YajG